ncbi:hypothetical protein D9M71_579350 [compost metagenome]
MQAQAAAHHFTRRQLFVQIGIFRHIADAPARARIVRGTAHQQGLAGIGAQRAEQDLDAGALAGAVLADEAHRLAGLDDETHIIQGLDGLALALEGLVQPLHLDRFHCESCFFT